MDISKRESVIKFFQGIPAEFKDIAVLINNAGCAIGADHLHQVKDEDFDQMFDTNVKGLVKCTQFVLSTWLEKSQDEQIGRQVLNIGSIAGISSIELFVKKFRNTGLCWWEHLLCQQACR